MSDCFHPGQNRLAATQNGELLPKREILQHKLPAVTKKANEYSEPVQSRLYMGRGYSRHPLEPGL
jgi:hypothetical protein